MTRTVHPMPSIAGMPVEPDEERWLALDRELDAMRERFRRYGGHTEECIRHPLRAPSCDCSKCKAKSVCSCGFAVEWRKVFGASKGVDSRTEEACGG